MGMDDIKRTGTVFGLKQVMDERTAHVVYFRNEIGIQRKRAAMVVNTVDALISRLVWPKAGKYMDLMPFPFQRGGEFGNMDAHTADRN